MNQSNIPNALDTYWLHKEKYPVFVFYHNKDFRIIFTMGIHHNCLWLDKITPNDYLFVIMPCLATDGLFYFNDKTADFFDLNRNHIFVLCKNDIEVDLCKKYSFNPYLIHQNSFLDENIFDIREDCEKIYDAIVITRPTPQKRTHLLMEVDNLAIISGLVLDGISHIDITEIPHSYINKEFLTPEEVAYKINQSKVGICPSKNEGGCFASSEFLLCGLPVVSTPSNGGREVFYNDYNSLICEPDEGEIARAVCELIEQRKDPNLIRGFHLEKMYSDRDKLIALIDNILLEHGVSIDLHEYFDQHIYNKFFMSFHSPEDALKILEETEPCKR